MENAKKTIRGKVKIIRKISDKTDTYDIQTPNQNFFANGVLVHNSEILLRDKEFCNLSEVVVRPDDTEETLTKKIRLATILGTWQASLTHFPYLSSEWKKNCEEEALLGVSLTGVTDNVMMRTMGTDLDKLLQRLKKVAIDTNKEWAKKLKINQAAAITCNKPSGCGTLDTQIKTTDGDTTFRDIFNLCGYDPELLGDGSWITPSIDIFVYDENNDERKVTNLYIKGYSPVFEIEDEYGNVYKFSSEHKLKTSNGWKCMREITIDDEILSFDPLENMKTLYTIVNQGEPTNETSSKLSETI